MYACLGIHPHEAATSSSASSTSCASLLAHPKAVAVGETGLDYFRDYAPHDAQQRLFDAQLALARDVGKPVVIHTRAADDDTRDAPRRARRPGDPPLLLVAGRCSSRRSSDGWYVSFAGNVTYKNAYDLRAAARRVPADRLLAETDSPYLAPQAVRGRRNEPAYVVHTYDVLAEVRGVDADELAAQIDANATRSSGCERRVRAKSLGQHFLVDENILGVIERLAELDAGDVVLEIGPGLGILTRFLAERVAHVHAVEVDRRLEPHLEGIPRTTVHWGDALAPRHPRRSSRRRASSSRTCRTTSPRRSSPRASSVDQLDALVRDGAARGRRPVLRRAVDEGVRRGVGARPARDRAHRVPSGLARGVPAAAERRLRARRVPAHRAGRASRRSSASSRRRSRTAARRSRTRSRSPGSRRATAPPRRSRRSGARANVRAEALEPHEFLALAEALR